MIWSKGGLHHGIKHIGGTTEGDKEASGDFDWAEDQELYKYILEVGSITLDALLNVDWYGVDRYDGGHGRHVEPQTPLPPRLGHWRTSNGKRANEDDKGVAKGISGMPILRGVDGHPWRGAGGRGSTSR